MVGKDDSTPPAARGRPPGPLEPVPLGCSAALRVGDRVLALGYPFGSPQRQPGDVTGIDRRQCARLTVTGAIQTDAASTPAAPAARCSTFGAA